MDTGPFRVGDVHCERGLVCRVEANRLVRDLRGSLVRVVCAACNEHYADVPDESTFEEKLVLSDALAVYHLAHCQASAQDKNDAWELMEAITKAETAGAV